MHHCCSFLVEKSCAGWLPRLLASFFARLLTVVFSAVVSRVSCVPCWECRWIHRGRMGSIGCRIRGDWLYPPAALCEGKTRFTIEIAQFPFLFFFSEGRGFLSPKSSECQSFYRRLTFLCTPRAMRLFIGMQFWFLLKSVFGRGKELFK